MSLSWVNRLILPAVLAGSISAHADTISVDGTYLLPETMSKAACYQKALMQAKQNAVRQVLGERLSNEMLEVCEETEQQTSCRLFQQTLNWFDDGYLASLQYDRSQNRIIAHDGFEECLVRITAEVKGFTSKPDPSFGLSAEIVGPRRKRHGEAITISGETTQHAHLSLLGWYPELDGDHFYRIVPNEYDAPEKAKGKFAFPTAGASASYELFASWDSAYQESELSEASEVILVLATKKDFPLLEVEPAGSFYKRLDELGRENWKIAKLTYFVMGND